MKEYFVLEYKTIDKKGREKNAQFAGIYVSKSELHNAKNLIAQKNSNRVSFQVYSHNNIFP